MASRQQKSVKRGPGRNATYSFVSILERSTNRLWGAHVRVPARIAGKFTGNDTRRVVCSLNDSTQHQCAILPFGKGEFVITVNKKRRETLRLEFGMEVKVSVRKDDSKYGLPLAGELEEVLRQDPEGRVLFHALTPGRRRTLLYIVNSVKSSERRVARAVIIVNHLKANSGKINFRQLSVMLRASPLRGS